MPALPRLFQGLGLGSLAVIVALGLALPHTARSSGTGKGEGSGVQWLRMTHAAFQEFLLLIVFFIGHRLTTLKNSVTVE